MRQLLLLLTQKDDPLVAKMLECQAGQSGCAVHSVDLTQPEVDYEALLEKIFAADSVQVW
jgi:hypothetical protein